MPRSIRRAMPGAAPSSSTSWRPTAPWSSRAAAPTRRPGYRWSRSESGNDRELDLDVWGRNCDRAIERSTPLEAVDQVLTLLLAHARQLEVDPHRVEQVDVGADRRA